jgi:hypothetical protein
MLNPQFDPVGEPLLPQFVAPTLTGGGFRALLDCQTQGKLGQEHRSDASSLRTSKYRY